MALTMLFGSAEQSDDLPQLAIDECSMTVRRPFVE